MGKPRKKSDRATSSTSAFAVVGLRDFRLLLTGSILGNAAMWIQQITLGWLVYDLTSSGTALGTLNLVRSVATVGLAPFAGLAIDRFTRRGLMLVANGWLCVITSVFAVALLVGPTRVWWLFLYTFLGGVAQALNAPLRRTVVVELVPRPMAPNAVALVQTGWALMRSVGPAVGGFLILWLGPGGNFLVQSAAYALITVTILRIRFPAAKGETNARKGSLSRLKEGFRFVATDRGTRAFTLMGLALPLLIIPNFAALPPIYAKEVFGGGPEVLGLLMSAVGLGGIGGGIVTVSLGSVERRGVVQLVALLLTGVSLIAFSLTSRLEAALPLLAVAGFFEMIHLTTNQTLLQLSVPDHLRGRVTGIVGLNMGLNSVGGVLAGIGADLFGPQTVTIILCGLAGIVAIVVFFASPTIREHRMSRALGLKD